MWPDPDLDRFGDNLLVILRLQSWSQLLGEVRLPGVQGFLIEDVSMRSLEIRSQKISGGGGEFMWRKDSNSL